MTSTNDVTGDLIKTKGTSDAYRDNYDMIFGRKKKDLYPGLDKGYDGTIDKESMTIDRESMKTDEDNVGSCGSPCGSCLKSCTKEA